MYVQTADGGTLSLIDPSPEDVRLPDIAHALSHLCRYTGHSRDFYSVAQHSVLAARLARERCLGLGVQRQALLHDAAEAYVGDVASPLKALLPGYRQLEAEVAQAIARRFGIPRELSEEVHRIDRALLMWEAPQLLGPLVGDGWPEAEPAWEARTLVAWSPAMARLEFLDEARRLGVR